MEINTFFRDNQPISVELDPGGGAGQFVIRGYQVPVPGASEVTVEADLICLAASGKRTVERNNVSIATGAEVELGPVRFKVVELNQLSRELAQGTIERPGRVPDAALVFEPSEEAIESVELVDDSGKAVKFHGDRIAKASSRTQFLFQRPELERVRVRATYFENSETIRIPIRISTGLGF